MVLLPCKKFYMLSLIFTEVVRADVIQGFSLRFCFLFEIAVTGQNALSSFSIVCKKIWNELFVSLLPISRVLLLSILSSAIWIFFRFSAVYFLLKILLFGFSEISLGMKMYCVRWSKIEVTSVSSWNTFSDVIVENIINYRLRSACDSSWNVYCGIKRIWVYCVNKTWCVSS